MTIFAIYIIFKIAIYTLWCRLGLHLLNPLKPSPFVYSFGYSIVRIILGLGLGYIWSFILLLTSAKDAEYNRLGFSPLIFYAGIILLRWCIWSFMSFLLRSPGAKFSLFGVNGKDWLWRSLGVVISTLGDILVLMGVVGLGEMPC